MSAMRPDRHARMTGRWRARPARRLLAAALLSGALLPPAGALACGFHTVTSMQQGVLNMLYPEALHVSGATWRQQQAGRLPMPDPRRLVAKGDERARLHAEGYPKAAAALHALGLAMETRQTVAHAFTITLVRQMLSTRYDGQGAAAPISVELHVDGPTRGELLVVTEEPVLHALAAGDMAVAEALDLGLIKLFGTEAQVSAFEADFADLGTEAAPRPSRKTMLTIFLGAGRGAAPAPNMQEPILGN